MGSNKSGAPVSGFREPNSSSIDGGQSRKNSSRPEDAFSDNALFKNNGVHKWLRNYEHVCKSKGWSSERMLSSVPRHLGASARKWFENHSSELKTWEIFKSKIVASFGKEELRIVSERLLQKRVQLPYEAVAEYIHDVLRLCDEIDFRMPELKRVEHLIRGLSDLQLLSDVINNPPKSVAKFMEQCFHIEKQKYPLVPSTPTTANTITQKVCTGPSSMVFKNADKLRVQKNKNVNPKPSHNKSNAKLKTSSCTNSKRSVVNREHVTPRTTFNSADIKNDKCPAVSAVQNIPVLPLSHSNQTCVRSNIEPHRFPCQESTQTFSEKNQVQRLQSLNDSYTNLVRLTSTGNLERVSVNNSNLIIVKDIEDFQQCHPTTKKKEKLQTSPTPNCQLSYREKEEFPKSIPTCNKYKVQTLMAQDPIAVAVEEKILQRPSVTSLSPDEQRTLIRDVVRDIVKEEIALSRTPKPKNFKLAVASAKVVQVVPKDQTLFHQSSSVTTLAKDVTKHQTSDKQISPIATLVQDVTTRRKRSKQSKKQKKKPSVATLAQDDTKHQTVDEQTSSIATVVQDVTKRSKPSKKQKKPWLVDCVSTNSSCNYRESNFIMYCNYCCMIGHSQSTCWKFHATIQQWNPNNGFPWMCAPQMPFYHMNKPPFFHPSMNSCMNIFRG